MQHTESLSSLNLFVFNQTTVFLRLQAVCCFHTKPLVCADFNDLPSTMNQCPETKGNVLHSLQMVFPPRLLSVESACFKYLPMNNVIICTGQDRSVTSKDRVLMPYTDAVLLETLRKANIVPTALPHTLDESIIVDGKVHMVVKYCIF